MGKNNRRIKVNDVEIRITSIDNSDYICITDMISVKDGDFFVSDWLRNRNTLEFLATWETLNNPNFNYGEFAIITNKSGLNNFKISVSEWVDRTNAIGITAIRGRYGGTYAHEDIAMEFGTWISPQFKLYLITEFKRLKELESNKYNLEWNVKRVLSKVNYTLHTDAIQQYIIPKLSLSKDKEWIEYAKEADLLNVALFGCTAKQWKEANPTLSLEGKNVRDIASINELAVLSNMESLNSIMIQEGVSKNDRFSKLSIYAKHQLKTLNEHDFVKSLKHNSDSTYPLAIEDVKKKKSIPEAKPEKTIKIKDKKKGNKEISLLAELQQALRTGNFNVDNEEEEDLSDFNKKLKQGLNFNPKEDKK